MHRQKFRMKALFHTTEEEPVIKNINVRLSETNATKLSKRFDKTGLTKDFISAVDWNLPVNQMSFYLQLHIYKFGVPRLDIYIKGHVLELVEKYIYQEAVCSKGIDLQLIIGTNQRKFSLDKCIKANSFKLAELGNRKSYVQNDVPIPQFFLEELNGHENAEVQEFETPKCWKSTIFDSHLKLSLRMNIRDFQPENSIAGQAVQAQQNLFRKINRVWDTTSEQK